MVRTSFVQRWGRPPCPRSRLAPVVLLWLLVGCAHTSQATPVVDIGGGGPMDVAPPVAPPPPEGAPSPEAVAPFVGTWEDESTAGRVNTRVELHGGVPTVVSVKEVISDLETYKLESSTFKNGELRWIYYVPSTQYRVVLTATKPKGTSMPTTWSNSADASGTTNLLRVDGKR